MAGILKKMDEQRHILAWSEEVKKAFNKSFFNPETGCYSYRKPDFHVNALVCGTGRFFAYWSRVMQNLEDSIRAPW